MDTQSLVRTLIFARASCLHTTRTGGFVRSDTLRNREISPGGDDGGLKRSLRPARFRRAIYARVFTCLPTPLRGPPAVKALLSQAVREPDSHTRSLFYYHRPRHTIHLRVRNTQLSC